MGNAATRRNPFISTYRYVDVETKDELNDGTNLVFIDLYSFNKQIDECNSLDEGRAKGLVEGRADGRAEGRAEGGKGSRSDRCRS